MVIVSDAKSEYDGVACSATHLDDLLDSKAACLAAREGTSPMVVQSTYREVLCVTLVEGRS